MASTNKNMIDAEIRRDIFNMLNIANIDGFEKVNERQYGIIRVDSAGKRRYVRVGAIVAEEREDMTADELMAQEIAKYEGAQARKAERAAAAAEKAAKDKEKREKAAAAKAAKAASEDEDA